MILTRPEIREAAETASDYDGTMSNTYFAECLERSMLLAIELKDPAFHAELIKKLAELGLNHAF
jgi:hypothetical protein